jgi:predicted Ser/Thr protein kinase/tetratricopeptide (TPR) repeat protein
MVEGDLPAGTRIADRYVLVEPLGRGGMGVVHRARDDKLGRHVAVKLLPPDKVGDAAARSRLIREARAAAGLEHPGIVRVYDVGETSTGGAFLIMELVRGRSLRAAIRDEAIDRLEALRIVDDVAHTLGAAHEAGLVHRDIKPDNIMVRDDGRVVVLDFGLVKSLLDVALSETQTPDTPTLMELTKAGSLLGTPVYMAPEQARGQSVPATDQWALAVVAFELLTGSVPWSTANPTFLLAQILTEPAPSASSAVDVPAAVDGVFSRALNKDPAARFESIVEFSTALRDAVLEGKRSYVPPPLSRPRAGGRFAKTPLSLEGSVLGCPLLEARGFGGPGGWAAAAAAAIVAARARWLLGGDPERTLPPAELLDLPRYPIESFARDPFDEPTARDDTLAEARVRADAYVDGVVRRRADGFTVELRLHARPPTEDEAGRVLADGRGKARALYDATRRAMEGLVGSAGVPRADALAPEVQAWTDLAGVDAGLALLDFWLAHAEARSGEAERAERHGPALGALRSFVRAALEDPERVAVPALDRSSPRAFVMTALARYVPIEGVRRPPVPEVSPEAADELAAELHHIVTSAAPAPFRARAAAAECAVLAAAGELDRARTAAVRAVQLDHSLRLGWHFLGATSDLGRTQHLVYTAGCAWFPWDPYLLLSRGRTTSDAELRLSLLRRAHALLPGSPPYVSALGEALLETGAREEARALAVESLDGDAEQSMVGEMLMARVDAAEARFGRAYARVVRALEALPGLGSPTGVDSMLAFLLRELAELLGCRRDASDLFLARFVDVDPPRLDARTAAPAVAAIHCALASPEVAERCATRLDGVGDEHVRELLRGAVAFNRGDFEAAALAFRRFASSPSLWSMRFAVVMAPAFDAANEPELAERVDAWMLDEPGSFNGANLAYVRAARRAEARGDDESARRWARAVVDAWAASDPPVAAVGEMQSLLGRLPSG